MKKIISVLLAAALIFIMSSMAFAVSDELIVDGSYEIIISSDRLLESAEKFADYIKNICGDELSVTTASTGKSAIKISFDYEKTENRYSIVCDGKDISITGSDMSQTVRGMYAFLEKFGGVRCYTSKEVTYTKTSITVPADTDYTYTPYFEYTETDWNSSKDVQYSLFNGINGADNREIPECYGGGVDYISSFCHTLTGQFCSSDKYFEEHPEYFALSMGKRKNAQLCMTNPKVREIIKQEVFDLLKEKHDPDASLQIISLTQADNIFYCTCDNCKKADKKYGSHAGSVLETVNYIAKAVKDAGYDNVAIDTFAYQYTRTPPENITLEDNVIIRLCSFECCFSHALDDSSCKANAEFMRDLDGWSKICKRIYVWDYCTNFNNLAGLYPDFGTLGRNMQIFYEHNVKGVYEEGNYCTKIDAEFGDLRSYLISRLFINPYLDCDELIKEFCSEYYGDGGEYVHQFLKLITENASEKHLCIYQPMYKTLSLSVSQVKECNALWEKAKESATGEAKENVLRSELSWRYWKMKNLRAEFSSLINYNSEKTQLLSDMNDRGITRLSETEDDTRDFFVSFFWDLYVSKYSVVNIVLKILYAV